MQKKKKNYCLITNIEHLVANIRSVKFSFLLSITLYFLTVMNMTKLLSWFVSVLNISISKETRAVTKRDLRPTHRRTDRQADSSIHTKTFVLQGYKKCIFHMQS